MLRLIQCSSQPVVTRRGLARRIALLAVLVGCALFQMQCVKAQEVAFTPRFDGVDQDSHPVIRTTEAPLSETNPERKIYSFARFSTLFKGMCASLRTDLREGRIFEAGTRGLEESGECGTCRALYRQVVQWCKPESHPPTKQTNKKVSAPTPAPSATAPSAPDGDGEKQSEDETEEASEAETSQSEIDETAEPREVDEQNEHEEPAALENAEEVAGKPTRSPSPSPSPSPTPQPARYPSTELIDAASRLSQGLYELEPGSGATFNATQRLTRDLLDQKDLTPAERDYYSIVSSYLLSAWEGRPGSPLDPRVQAKEDVSELFQ